MGIGAMIEHSEPEDLAMAALTAARAIITSRTLPPQSIARAKKLIEVDPAVLAEQIRQSRQRKARDAAAAIAMHPVQGQTSVPSQIGTWTRVVVDGQDLVLTLTGPGLADRQYEVTANEHVVEIRAVDSGAREMVQSIDLGQPLADENVTMVVNGNEATVRVRGAITRPPAC